MSYYQLLVLIPCSVILCGCTSFSSTMFNRLDDNSVQAISNGELGKHNSARPYKGVPVTLKVPTHLDVFIDETYYLGLNGTEAEDFLQGQCPLLDVRAEVVKSDKIVMVDFKRPGAGTLGLTLDFDQEEQYFSKIQSNLQDDTITQSAGLIAGVIDAVQAVSTSGKLGDDELKLLEAASIIRDKRVVAYRRFDINAVDFEMQVAAFVDQHLNGNGATISPSY